MTADDDVPSNVPVLVGMTIADLLGHAKFAAACFVGAVAGVALERWLIRCRERARQILIEEIRAGDRTIYDAEEVDAIPHQVTLELKCILTENRRGSKSATKCAGAKL